MGNSLDAILCGDVTNDGNDLASDALSVNLNDLLELLFGSSNNIPWHR